MIKLVLVRHGQSMWNLENKFTGWTDVELSEEGFVEPEIEERFDPDRTILTLSFIKK